jgi:hypothetical protein
LTATLAEPADALRTLELERLDRLHLAIWDQAIQGDVASTDRVLSIMKRRSALLGLDAPKRLAPIGSAGGPLTVIVREWPDRPQ